MHISLRLPRAPNASRVLASRSGFPLLLLLLIFGIAGRAIGQTIVDGTVVSGAGYKPVAGVTAYLINKTITPQVIRSQVTNGDGHYEFDDCASGDGYTVNVYDAKGNLVGTDPQFSLYPDSRHTAVPFLDISHPLSDERARLAGGRSLDAAISADTTQAPVANPATTSAPEDPEATLTEAIKDFYAFRYVHAEAKLDAYLQGARAKSKGAASFYLGASRLCRQMLENPTLNRQAAIKDEPVQQAFRDAHTAGYQPLAKYVSPLVMKAWQLSMPPAPTGFDPTAAAPTGTR